MISRAVRTAAHSLDRIHPGWHQKIDLKTFYMAGSRSCVLGQLYGNYSQGIEALGLINRTDGLRITRKATPEFPPGVFSGPQDAWVFEIQFRRARDWFLPPKVTAPALPLVVQAPKVPVPSEPEVQVPVEAEPELVEV